MIPHDPIGFTEEVLGLSLYPWQDRALAPLELATGPQARRVKIAALAPNGAGKSERIVANPIQSQSPVIGSAPVMPTNAPYGLDPWGNPYAADPINYSGGLTPIPGSVDIGAGFHGYEPRESNALPREDRAWVL